MSKYKKSPCASCFKKTTKTLPDGTYLCKTCVRGQDTTSNKKENKRLNKNLDNFNREPKILVFDIETSANLGYIWGKYEQNVLKYVNEWSVMCFCAKWLDNKKMIKVKQNDFKNYKKDKLDDYGVVKAMWDLLDEADVVITHNGDKFDIKKMNARFIYHGFTSPSSYKSIDTLKISRRYFKFNSNKLDDLGEYLKVGRKVRHEGFSLWFKCMMGQKKAWNNMIKYNIQDVLLLEKIYYKFLPWIANHPNIGLYIGKEYVCPKCGSEQLQKRGFHYTKSQIYQRIQCQDCMGWCRQVRAEKNITKPKFTN